MKARVTLTVDQQALFDAMFPVQENLHGLAFDLSPVLLTGKPPGFLDALRLALWGITVDEPAADQVEAVAFAMWKEEAAEGTPKSVKEGRTLEAFREVLPEVRERWERFARAALGAQEAHSHDTATSALSVERAERSDYLSDTQARELWGTEDDEALPDGRVRVCEGEWVRIPGGYYFDGSAGFLHPETASEACDDCEVTIAAAPSPNTSPAAKGGEADALDLFRVKWSYMPSYGEMSMDQLREAVSEAKIGNRYSLGPFDPSYSKGHQQVDGCNYNSLNRIVTTFVRAALATSSPQPATPRDVLDQDKINALPLPLIARFAGDRDWLPIHDIGVDAPLCRIDVSGKLEPRRFSEIMELKDGDGVIHNPDDFYLEEATPSPQPADAVRERASAFFQAFDRKPEKDCWSLADYHERVEEARDALRSALASDPAPAGEAVEGASDAEKGA